MINGSKLIEEIKGHLLDKCKNINLKISRPNFRWYEFLRKIYDPYEIYQITDDNLILLAKYYPCGYGMKTIVWEPTATSLRTEKSIKQEENQDALSIKLLSLKPFDHFFSM